MSTLGHKSNSASTTLCKGSGKDTRGSPRDEQKEKLREELRLVAILDLKQTVNIVKSHNWEI